MTYVEEIALRIQHADDKVNDLKRRIQEIEDKKKEDKKLLHILSKDAWSTKISSGEELKGTAIFGFAFDHLYFLKSSYISRSSLVDKVSEYCGYKFNARSSVEWGLILTEIMKRFDNDENITREYKNNKEFLKGIYYSDYEMPSDEK